MDIKGFIKKEFDGFNRLEGMFFVSAILLTVFFSVFFHDEIIVTVSAFCGISYTILAGKGKLSCFYIGLVGTLLYCYISYKNGFFGNAVLYGCYYFPMEIIGIFKWKKHLKKDKNEIIKKALSLKEKIFYTLAIAFSSALFGIFLNYKHDASPVIDSITTVASVFGLYLSVKRCKEQWYVWFIVNFLSSFMWITALMKGSPCLGTVLMWLIYTGLSVYFLVLWEKELKIAS